MPQRPGIYLILHLPTGKAYVGSSIDVSKRIYLHKRMLRLGNHHSPQLQRAFDRDGEGAFSFAVIERCAADDRIRREQLWINARQSHDDRFGYNVAPVSGHRGGVPQPAGFGALIAAVHRGKPKSAETRAKMSAAAKGRKKSPEHRAAIAEAVRLQMSDPERRAKQSENQRGKPSSFKGRKHTPESIEAMRAARVAHYADKPRAIRKPRIYVRKEGPHEKTGPKPGTARGDLRKLSDDQVRAIRGLWKTKSLAKIGRDFGIDAATVHSIVHRKTYADVADLPAISDGIEGCAESDMVCATEAPSHS